jgi:hypothetical protein
MRDSAPNSSQILDITLTLMGSQIEASTSVTLGQNVTWNADSEFMSNSSYASLIAEKLTDGTILMYFEGD